MASLVAEFDDLCRLRNTIVASETFEQPLHRLIKSMDDFRLKWLVERKLKLEAEELNEKLRREIKCLTTTLKNNREYLKKEIGQKEQYKKECVELRNQMNMAAQFLKDSKSNAEQVKEKALSYLNIQQLETVMESSESSGESCSDIDYDKTDEDNLDATAGCGVKRKSEGQLSGGRPSAKKNAVDEVFGPQDVMVQRTTAKSDLYLASNTWKGITPGCNPSAVSTPLLQKGIRSATMSATNTQDIPCRLENRAHKFVEKKLFTAREKCGPCGKAIGFCVTYLRCVDCRAVCHTKCRDKVPRPCIPYVAKNLAKKRGRLTKIGDFVDFNSRPCVPALMIHCCTEIEKRGLEEEGLYRVPGSDKQVKDLKERMLNSKQGMPVLHDVDIPVLCGVVKHFLRSLDEQLLTSVLWRDFLSAAELEDAEDKRTFLCQAVNELPTANRDSLAYLIVHLQRVAQSAPCKMPLPNLAKVIAATVVGNSIPNPPPMTIYSETHKQIKVMEELLNIPSSYWSNFITPAEIVQNQLNTTTDRRDGIGLFRASFSRGTLTPLHYKPSQDKIKPLF